MNSYQSSRKPRPAVYVYRFKYTCNNVSKYVNVIETKPYEYTLSFEQNSIPIVNNTYTETNEGTISSSTKTTIIDNIKYGKNMADNVYYLAEFISSIVRIEPKVNDRIEKRTIPIWR